MRRAVRSHLRRSGMRAGVRTRTRAHSFLLVCFEAGRRLLQRPLSGQCIKRMHKGRPLLYALLSSARHGPAWHGMAWCGMAVHGMAWHGMTCRPEQRTEQVAAEHAQRLARREAQAEQGASARAAMPTAPHITPMTRCGRFCADTALVLCEIEQQASARQVL
jgi:hypothetical protein